MEQGSTDQNVPETGIWKCCFNSLPHTNQRKKSLKSLFLDFFLSQHQGSEVIIEREVWFQVFLVCYSKEGRGFAFPGLQRSPSSLPAPSAFSRNISVCRVPLSTSFLILCREGKHRDAQGNSFSGPNHRGDPSENANTGQGEATEGALEHQAAPKHGIQSRDTPCDVPQFLPVAAGRALQAAAQVFGDLWLHGDRGMQEFWHPEKRNQLSQGIQTNWFANKGNGQH